MDSYELADGGQREKRRAQDRKDSRVSEGSSSCGDYVGRSPKWWQVFIAPWLGIVRPHRAVNTLVSGSVIATLAATLFPIVLLVTVVLGLVLREEMSELGSTAGEVWRIWYRAGLSGPAGGVVIWTAGLSLGALMFVPWLCFPRVYMGGGIRRCYWKTFRACLSYAGLAFLIAAAGVVSFAFILNESNLVRVGWIMSVLCAAHLLILRVVWVADFIRDPVPTDELPPRCEACGYDLTHQSEGGLCSECGFSIAESLTPGCKRSGCDWENGGGVWGFLRTTFEVLLKTEAFYEKLPVRSADDQARRFARRHYVLLGILGSFSFFLGLSVENNISLVVNLTLTVLLLWPIVGWLVMHAIFALVIFWWVARGSSMKVYLTRKIISYESAYLTLVSTLFAMLFGSFIHYGSWMTNALGHEFFANSFGLQAELLAIVLGIALSTGIWLWRITIGIRSVRWANS